MKIKKLLPNFYFCFSCGLKIEIRYFLFNFCFLGNGKLKIKVRFSFLQFVEKHLVLEYMHSTPALTNTNARSLFKEYCSY